MDDLSDEIARRRVFRGVHRPLKPVEDLSDAPRPDQDEVSEPVTGDIHEPYRDFVGADDHETFGAGFVQPGAYPDADLDPYPDLAPRRDALEADDVLASDPFASDTDRTGTWSTGGDARFSARARHAAPPPRDPGPSTRSVPLIPLPGVEDDLRGPAPVSGLGGSTPDLIDTLADQASPDVAREAPARRDSAIPAGAGNRADHRLRADGDGFPGPNRLDAAADAGAPIDRPDRSSGPAGGPGQPSAQVPPLPEAGSLEPSFTLSYEVATPAPAAENPSRDHGLPRADSEPANPRFGPAAGPRDGEAIPGPEASASAQAATPLTASARQAEPPEPDIAADQLGPVQDARTSDHPRRSASKPIAFAAALAPVLVVSGLMYAQPDILKRLEDITGRPQSGSAPRVGGGPEPAVGPDTVEPAAPQSSAPRPDAQTAGEAPPVSSEIEARLQGNSASIPKLVNDPLPILTAIPSATATAEPEAAGAMPPGSNVAPGARTATMQGPGSPPPVASEPPDGKATPDETRHTPAALVPDAAPTPSVPDAEAQGAKAPRSAARRAKTRALAPDDLLNVKAERLLAAGDVLAARTLFQSLVTAGDPRGARGVAQTYDPRVLGRFPASGVKPDQAEAARWQAIAARLETRQRRNPGEAAP